MTKTQANLLLITAAALWGFGNVAQKTVLQHLDPYSAVGLRCLIGGLLILPLLKLDGGALPGGGFWRSALKVAVIFTAATLVQQLSYHSASVTNASFLVNTAAVMTPFVAWTLLRERPNLHVIGAAGVTLVGAFLMCGGLVGFGEGDLLALVSAFFYALWMVELGRHMKVFGNPVRTAATQFLSAAAVALPVGAASGSLSIVTVTAAWPELVILGIGSTAVAFGIQTVAQRYTPASHAAVIVSAEGIFGTIGAICFLGEVVSMPAVIGACLIFSAIVYLAAREGINHASAEGASMRADFRLANAVS